jgi:hypothetical protein
VTHPAVTFALPSGGTVLVDDADLGLLLERSWWVDAKGYALAKARGAGRKGSVSLHRLIAGAKPGQIVDHIDGNTLNNSRANLRIASALENARNVRHSKNTRRGGFKGVYFVKKSRKWGASIGAGEKKANGRARMVHLGCFETPELAALAYDEAAREYFGEFAATNFPATPLAPQGRNKGQAVRTSAVFRVSDGRQEPAEGEIVGSLPTIRRAFGLAARADFRTKLALPVGALARAAVRMGVAK